MSPPSESDVRAAVAELRPDVPVTDIDTVEAGKNAVYAVSFADREAILKVGTASPDRVRAEPAVVQFVRNRTRVPVPRVLQTSEDVLEQPCCLFEEMSGRTVPDRANDLELDVLARLCTEAGRHLADLHGVDEFEQFGPLVPGDDGTVVTAPAEDWPSLLGRAMDAKIGALGERFAQFREALRAYADGVGDECRRAAPFDPVLVHMDYRPANLVIASGESPITQAVLDWAGAAAAPAAYEVAHAEALLTDWPRFDDDERARLRESFRSGYTAGGGVLEIPDVYRVDARLRLMKHLEMEVGDRDATVIEARVDEHVRSLDALDALP